MATLTDIVIRNIIEHLIRGEDYRVEVLALIDAEFLQYVVDFFRKVVDAKLRSEAITTDWYKAEFLDPSLSSDDLIIHSGLNKKSIGNMYNSTKRDIVLRATEENYENLRQLIDDLIQQAGDLDIALKIEFRGISINLNISESLVIINTLAVKRAQLRGGLWSTAGKQVEKPLLVTLCKLFNVPEEYYSIKRGVTDVYQREIDFFLFGPNAEKYNCEVKLMGKGNPESADAIFARNPSVFVADKMSDLNKRQADGMGIHWVELRSPEGYYKFLAVLQELRIPCRSL